MAPKVLLPLLLLCLMRTLLSTSVSSASTKSTGVNPFACSDRSKKTCTSLLYQHNNLRKEQIASFYSVNGSQIAPISHGNEQNFLVLVPCSCQEANGAAGVTVGYFYNTVYKMQDNESSADVASKIYSGQAWEVGPYDPGEKVPIHLMCGCAESDSQIIVTYTVQGFDTLSDIAALLSARTSEIQRLNKILMENSTSIDVGWVLFVPMEKNGIPRPNSGEWELSC